MNLNAYSIYDRKALIYSPPFFSATDGTAMRSFAQAANDLNTNIGRFPADFVLYRVGQFNDAKGIMLPESPLTHVADATALVQVHPDLFNASTPAAGPSRPVENGRE